LVQGLRLGKAFGPDRVEQISLSPDEGTSENALLSRDEFHDGFDRKRTTNLLTDDLELEEMIVSSPNGKQWCSRVDVHSRLC